MFGFGKKSKNNKNKKAIEFEIVTMESALEDSPQTMVISTNNEKAKEEERARIERADKKEQELKEREKRTKKDEAKARNERRKIEKESNKQRERELEEHEKQLALEEESQKKLKQEEKHELKLEQEQEKIQQQRRGEEEQKEREELEQQQKQFEQGQGKKTVKKIVKQEPSISPFLSDADVAEQTIEANTSDIRSPEQIYAQALNVQRNEDIREMATEELARREKLFSSKRAFADSGHAGEEFAGANAKVKSVLSSELDDREKIKKTRELKKLFHKRRSTQGTSFNSSRIKPRKEGINKPLLFIAVLIFIITAAAAAYYYFFVINIPGEEWIPITIPTSSQKDTTMLDPAPDSLITSKVNVLKNASLRSLNENTFSDDLTKLISALKGDSSKSATLQQGMFVRPVRNDGQKIEALSLLSSLGISNEEIKSVVTEDAWLFLVKEERNTLNGELSIVKVNLVITLDAQLDAEKVIETISSVEQQLPQQFLGLFVEEEKPSLPQKISFEPSFTDSQVAPQTRYFNYKPGNAHQSIDWGIAAYLEKNYLIISTSKNSTEKLIESLK